MSSPRPRRHRRGYALPAAALALTIVAGLLAEWARQADRQRLRQGAEATAQRIDALAWHLDHWLHSDPSYTVVAATAPRRLTDAEAGMVVGTAAFAAPWLGSLSPVTTLATPPASASWHVRFAVGWPSGSDPAAAGTGPPYGVLLATALTDRAREQAPHVREALRRRGGGVPTGVAGGAQVAATGATGVEIARATGLTVGGNDIALMSWRHGRILRGLALRRQRAGHGSPGMVARLELAAGLEAGRVLVDGDAAFGSVAAAGARLEANRLAADGLEGGELEIEAGTTVAGDLTAAGLAVERLEVPEGTVSVSDGSTSSVRIITVQGNASTGTASVQAARVRGSLRTDSMSVGLVTAVDLETPVLDLSGSGGTRVTDRFWAHHLKLGGQLDVNDPGWCRGCLNDQ